MFLNRLLTPTDQELSELMEEVKSGEQSPKKTPTKGQDEKQGHYLLDTVEKKLNKAVILNGYSRIFLL